MDTDGSLSNVLTDIVVMNVKVFDTCMESRVESEAHSTIVIAEQGVG